MIEMDVRLRPDHHVVVLHDATLDRLFGKPGRISRLSYAQIKERSDGKVPLLSEVLAELRGKIKFYVEVKASRLRKSRGIELTRATSKVIASSGAQKDCLVASFHYAVGLLYRSYFPKGWTGCIVGSKQALCKASKKGFKNMDAICPHQKLLTPRLVAKCKALGKQIFPWVIDGAKEQQEALAMGVDGIVTNDPAALVYRLQK